MTKRIQLNVVGCCTWKRNCTAEEVAPDTEGRAMLLSERVGLVEVVPSLHRHPVH